MLQHRCHRICCCFQPTHRLQQSSGWYPTHIKTTRGAIASGSAPTAPRPLRTCPGSQTYGLQGDRTAACAPREAPAAAPPAPPAPVWRAARHAPLVSECARARANSAAHVLIRTGVAGLLGGNSALVNCERGRTCCRLLLCQSAGCSSGCAPMATAGSSFTAWLPWPQPMAICAARRWGRRVGAVGGGAAGGRQRGGGLWGPPAPHRRIPNGTMDPPYRAHAGTVLQGGASGRHCPPSLPPCSGAASRRPAMLRASAADADALARLQAAAGRPVCATPRRSCAPLALRPSRRVQSTCRGAPRAMAARYGPPASERLRLAMQAQQPPPRLPSTPGKPNRHSLNAQPFCPSLGHARHISKGGRRRSLPARSAPPASHHALPDACGCSPEGIGIADWAAAPPASRRRPTAGCGAWRRRRGAV